MARYEQTFRGERRTAHVGIQLTPTEREALEKAASRRGMGISEYVRENCFHTPGPAPEIKRNPVAKELIHEFRALGNNINQIARIANINGEIKRESELEETLALLRRAIAKVLAL